MKQNYTKNIFCVKIVRKTKSTVFHFFFIFLLLSVPLKGFCSNDNISDFATKKNIPTATVPTLSATTTATSITCSTVISGGNVTSDGGAVITERGIVYSTSPNPETSNSKVTTSGTTGSYTATISDLNPSTLYHVRAYAINSAGTAYGSEISFTTSADPISSSFYADRIYFKNGTAADEKYYLTNNSVPNSDCTSANTETAGTTSWKGKYLGVTNSGTQLQLGGYLITKGVQNANTPKLNYRIYLTSTGPGATVFTQVNMNHIGDCTADGIDVNSNNKDKIFRKPLFNITTPTSPGNYTIEVYYERDKDEMGSGGAVYINNCGSNFKANIDIVRLEGIFSDAIYFNNGTSSTNYTAGGFDSCGGGLTIGGGNWNNKDLGIIAHSKTLTIGATALTLESTANIVKTGSTYLNYRVYKVGGVVPDFTHLNLTEDTGFTAASCGLNTSKFENNTGTAIYTTPASGGEGNYIIELFYSAQLNDNTFIYKNNNGSNYKAKFTLFSTLKSTLPVTDVFESYAFLKTEKTVGGVVTTTNDFYELDAAYGSTLTKGFIQPLGTFPPGTNFYLGAEMKIYNTDATATAHKACECSSWYYIYRPTDPAPQETDFPLPADGTEFSSTANGLFLKSAVLADVSESASEPSINSGGSTTNNTYNAMLGNTTGKDTSKIKKFQNKGTSIDTEMLFPTCIGDFKAAIALMVQFSSNGKCKGDTGYDISKLYYKRDINEPKLFNMAANGATPDLVNLNPSHPVVETDSNVKNSQTDVFYTTSLNITGNALTTHTWNGTSWSPPTGFANDSNLLFNADYTVGTDLTPGGNAAGFTVNSIKVADGKTVTIPNGKFIKVYNEGNTNISGKVIVANQANFVQSCNETGILSPNIELTKSTRAMKFQDYIYWGSPVKENIVSQLPSCFDRKYYWQSGPGATWLKLTTTIPAQGFITRITTAATKVPVTFKGTANNGIIKIPVIKEDDDEGNPANYALICNPYPCALDAKAFLSNAKNSFLGGTLSFWTSITPIAEINYTGTDQYRYNYNPEDYASWNFTGGITTAAKAVTDLIGDGSLTPTGKIASGQGFIAEIKNNGDVYFDNGMRLTANVNTQFFKQVPKGPKNQKSKGSDKTKTETKLEEGRVWLNISNQANFRQMLLGYMNGATNDYDERYDGEVYSDSPITIYSLLNNKTLSIQGRQLPFDEEEKIPLGYDTAVEGEFYINIDQADGFLENKSIYLEDKLLGIEHDLSQSAYQFSTTIGVFDNRFELKYTGKTLDINELETKTESVIIVGSKNQIKINSTNEELATVTIYDISGRTILSKKDINKKELLLANPTKQNGVLIVKATLKNNEKTTKKIILQN